MIIYRTSDRIPVRIGAVTFWVAPLSRHEKAQLMQVTTNAAGVQIIDRPLFYHRSVQYSVKRVEGMLEHDGTPYQLTFGPDGYLTEECVEELTNIIPVLGEACIALTGAVKDHGFEGVKIDLENAEFSKKKKPEEASLSPSSTS